MPTPTIEEARPFCIRLTTERQGEPGQIELFFSHYTPVPACREVAAKATQWLGDKNMDLSTTVRYSQAPRRHGASLQKATIKYRSFPDAAIAPQELLHYELQEQVQPHCGYIGTAKAELITMVESADLAYRLTIGRQVWGTEVETYTDVMFTESRVRSFVGSVAYTFLHPWTEADGTFGPEGALLVAERYMRRIDAFPLAGITVNV